MYWVTDLDYKSKYWSDVLLNRDWSMLEGLSLCNYANKYSVDCGITDSTIKIFCHLNWPKLSDLNISIQ